MQRINPLQYLTVLVITLSLFIVALVSSRYVNERKTEELKAMENKIAVDILSLETQLDLLKESSCALYDKNVIQRELKDLSSRLGFMENQLGSDDPEVTRLKQYYYVLEIQDYLLNKKMAAECGYPAVFILYFYGNDCEKCLAQDYMLRVVQDSYPQTVTVYSFDYDTVDLPALQTLVSLHNIPENPPILDINGKVFAGFDSLESLQLQIDRAFASSSTTTAPTR